MESDRSQPRAKPFPYKLIAMASLTTLAVLAWSCWHLYDVYHVRQDNYLQIFELERVRGDIVYFDEVLTMSASMAAATAKFAWIDRYRVFELKLYTALETATKLARQPAIADAIRETDAANGELVRMENQAFALIRELELGEAREILSGNRYLIQKQVYASGMEKLLRAIRAEQEIAAQSQQTSTLDLIVVLAAVAAAIMVVWLLVLVRVHIWRVAITNDLADLARTEAALRASYDERVRGTADRDWEVQDETGQPGLAESALRES